MAFGGQTKTGGLSRNSPIYGWWRPAWNLSFEGRVRNVATPHRKNDGRESRCSRCKVKVARAAGPSGGTHAGPFSCTRRELEGRVCSDRYGSVSDRYGPLRICV